MNFQDFYQRTVHFGQRILIEVFYYIQIGLRFMSLHLTLTRWTQTEDRPKVVLYRHRGVALVQSTIHFAPLAIVITSMVLNIRSYHWGFPSTSVLTALQFASKFAEILIQSSLANILLHFIRQRLLSPHSLPLGSLLGPYSITDISYLWSLELWGGLTTKYVQARQRIVSTSVIAAMVMLAAVVGPSIAVLLVPRPTDYSIGRYLFLVDDEATHFPKEVGLNGSSLP